MAPDPAFGGTLETFTLPAPAAGEGIFHGDLQASFPGLDWTTLDRLYIPAGHWKAVFLGNLPDRSSDRPLVITNLGGQVRIGGLGFNNYVFLLTGGSHWVLTGRYDAAAQTGSPDFRGHAAGYAHSQGRYGIFLDDAFESTGESGLAISGGATDFEVEFLEIARVGFAGALIKTDDQGNAHMANVRLHDLYIHDTGSEGLYIGSTQSPPQHKFPALQLYNNRVLRAGTELVQLGQIGRGSEIHHNVFFLGALDWKNPFGPFQDNAGQIGVREGQTSFHHNILIGGASTFFQLFPQPRTGDTHMAGDTVSVESNYFSHSRSFGSYVHADSDGVTEYRFADNWFRDINFHYDELDPGQTNYNTVFRTFNTAAPMSFTDNTWSGPQVFLQSSNTPNILASGNLQVGAIPDLEFYNSGLPSDFDYHRLEIWTALDEDGSPVSYEVGDHVLDSQVPGGGTLYRCLQANSGLIPANNPQAWEALPVLADDLRLHPLSPFQGFGLLDAPDPVFIDGFESGGLGGWSDIGP
jgi:hypothetical protein